MSNWKKELDQESIEDAEKFIKDIKSGLYFNRHTHLYPESEQDEESPIDQAEESFKHFITTDESV